MKRTAPRAHYVRHNKVSRIPRAHVYLDSEAVREVTPTGELQSFRLAVTAYDRRKHAGEAWREREWGEHYSTDELWTWITERAQRRARTVVVAHNLAYDLRITDAFGWLPAHGWKLLAIRLGDRQAWCSWRQDDRTLVMVDSMAWVPIGLERVGELCEIAKLPLPAWDDSNEAWLERCRRDVEILAELWRRVLAWLDTDDLGNFKPTGAGQAWAAFRHRFMTDHLFVHEDEVARAAERYSSHTGRCEAWRHGALRGGPFTEWDYTSAYAQIGADCAVPVKLNGELHAPTLADVQRIARKCAVLAEVEVSTSVPTVPCRTDAGIVWPVGTFATTLWENEIQLAVDHGAHVAVARAWFYRRRPALGAFCAWVLSTLEADAGTRSRLIESGA
jgi:hypothetical protein